MLSKLSATAFLQLLRGVKLMIADRDLVVLAEQQREDVDIILAALRPIDEKARARALAQRVIDIFGVVREHAEGAVAAHHGVCPGKRAHQHGGDFLLASRGLAVAALACDLVDIIDRAIADDARIKDRCR